jgi:hypothetical protein
MRQDLRQDLCMQCKRILRLSTQQFKHTEIEDASEDVVMSSRDELQEYLLYTSLFFIKRL